MDRGRGLSFYKVGQLLIMFVAPNMIEGYPSAFYLVIQIKL